MVRLVLRIWGYSLGIYCSGKVLQCLSSLRRWPHSFRIDCIAKEIYLIHAELAFLAIDSQSDCHKAVKYLFKKSIMVAFGATENQYVVYVSECTWHVSESTVYKPLISSR